MEVQFRQHRVALREGETVLAGLLRQGLPVRYSCRAGSCHACLMRASDGRVPAEAQKGLKADLVRQGFFLPCRCIPEEPLRIDQFEADPPVASLPVIETFMLAEDIRCIRLPADRAVDPLPGQHIGIVGPDGHPRRYSVASLPRRDGHLELHVRKVPGGRVSGWLVDDLRAGDRLDVLPPGGAMVHDRDAMDGALLLVATGTGLAPMIPILREALAGPETRPVWLLHGAQGPEGLYADAWLRTLDATHPLFHYRACCSRQGHSKGCFPGRVTDWLMQYWPSLGTPSVRVAGRPGMVEAVVEFCRRQVDGASLDVLADPFHPHGELPPVAGDRGGQGRRAPPPDPELWARLGNGRILREVLRDFYDLAFEDERLGPYFAGVTRQRLREKQYSFLRSLMLGRRDYMGQRPRNAHHWMVISDDLFDYRIRLLEGCMRDHGLTDEWIGRWHVYEAFFRADIVKAEPLPRQVGGREVVQQGTEEARLEDGGVCDGCGRIIECGERVRFHLRLGAVYCLACSRRDPSGDTGRDGSAV
ncbi:2Fe-2S iron-sulfur cluster-binding protein [Wenzhouxiangella sediminis]|uniref:2Fe-2S iron-sulfur cluster binding domain-containing protein n=1 Tax=Wenzhouxiangella sediminis TaxID=1792836 RepID=A0A3E1K9S0_9GAMM|nr:2Fe-2S iron-sulfur cluster-binding protein [Wenzhouxiangella sediminis]RFF30453.1 hypothetical protein DZC52_08180 [Wenzhouxiangella sediminis]